MLLFLFFLVGMFLGLVVLSMWLEVLMEKALVYVSSYEPT